jgi:rare lipoprotein A
MLSVQGPGALAVQAVHGWLARERVRHRQIPINGVSLAAALAATVLGGCATSSGMSGSVSSSLAPGFDAPRSTRAPMFPEEKWGVSASRRVASESDRIRKGGGRYKVGDPYQVGGLWYNPREQPDYDRIGVASWYGSDFHGRHTSNGEVYDMQALTAAHPTLPMPSYAYVTNLANNRTILVRINDRGPYVNGRVIDLSKASAHALGLFGRGTGKVRVRYAGPAPLNGDDSRERQFLASRPWIGGNEIAALEREAPDPAPVRFPSGEERWAAPVAYRPVAETGATEAWQPRDAWQAPDARPYSPSYGAAWSPVAYRTSLTGR